MGEHRSTVSSYIARSPTFAQPILEHLRTLIHDACPETREAIKWSMPFFLYENAVLCNMAGFRAHCAFGFWDRRMTPLLSERGVLCGAAMGSLGRIRSVDDLPDDATMSTLLARAREFASEGKKGRLHMSRPPRAEIVPPEDLLAALAARAGASAHFAGMSPSCRREYAEWIVEAKRPETRERRVREAVELIGEGRSRNSKTENR